MRRAQDRRGRLISVFNPQILNSQPSILNPQSSTLNPHSSNLEPHGQGLLSDIDFGLNASLGENVGEGLQVFNAVEPHLDLTVVGIRRHQSVGKSLEGPFRQPTAASRVLQLAGMPCAKRRRFSPVPETPLDHAERAPRINELIGDTLGGIVPLRRRPRTRSTG